MGKNLKWEEPPVTSVKSPTARKKYKRRPLAERLMEKPGQWAIVYEGTKYGSPPVSVRGPLFERTGRKVMVNGILMFRIYARYIGQGVPSEEFTDTVPEENSIEIPIVNVVDNRETFESIIMEAVRKVFSE